MRVYSVGLRLSVFIAFFLFMGVVCTIDSLTAPTESNNVSSVTVRPVTQAELEAYIALQKYENVAQHKKLQAEMEWDASGKQCIDCH